MDTAPLVIGVPATAAVAAVAGWCALRRPPGPWRAGLIGVTLGTAGGLGGLAVLLLASGGAMGSITGAAAVALWGLVAAGVLLVPVRVGGIWSAVATGSVLVAMAIAFSVLLSFFAAPRSWGTGLLVTVAMGLAVAAYLGSWLAERALASLGLIGAAVVGGLWTAALAGILGSAGSAKQIYLLAGVGGAWAGIGLAGLLSIRRAREADGSGLGGPMALLAAGLVVFARFDNDTPLPVDGALCLVLAPGAAWLLSRLVPAAKPGLRALALVIMMCAALGAGAGLVAWRQPADEPAYGQ